MSSQPIRILHVLQRMEAGGTQAFLMNLYRNIDRSKIQFDFLVQYNEEQFYDKEIESLGGRVYRSGFRENLNLFKFNSYLNSFFKEHQEYSIVHCHAYTFGYFVLRAAERNGVKVRIAHSHNNKMSGVGLTIPAKLVMRKLFPIHATHLMAASTGAGEFLFGNKKFTVIKNAIDVKNFAFDDTKRSAIRADLGIKSNFVIGNVGRLHQQKNQLFLLDIFSDISCRRPDAKLLMVGNGPLRQQIIDKAAKLNISDKLILLSNYREMSNLYQAMDVFVLPSLFEGLGIVTLEAQSSGLPTICSDGVAEEADVSPLFVRLPLKAGRHAWANKILELEGSRLPIDGPRGVIQHGFDVKQNSSYMQDWYLSHSSNK